MEWYPGVIHWPHRKPYVIAGGFSDGHGEFVEMGKNNYDAAVNLVQAYIANPTGTRNDQWAYFMHYRFAIDRKDMGPFGDFALKRDWTGAMNRYGHY
jgi:hypothetical protein